MKDLPLVKVQDLAFKLMSSLQAFSYFVTQFPYPVPVEQKEKQELLKQVSEEAGDILQKVNAFNKVIHKFPVVFFINHLTQSSKFCVLVVRKRSKTKVILS